MIWYFLYFYFRRPRKFVCLLLFLLSVIILHKLATMEPDLITPKIPWQVNDWKDWDYHPLAGRSTRYRINDVRNEIIILRWTKHDGQYLHRGPVKFRKGDPCSYPNMRRMTANCKVTYDRRYLNKSHAVIFHMWDAVTEYMGIGEQMPAYHRPGQIWIYQNHEPPTKVQTKNLHLLTMFNWTATYRADSDFYDPYGMIVRLPSNMKVALVDFPHLKELSASKTNLVAFIDDDCETSAKREKFVQELAGHIPVDTFGKCGYGCRNRCMNKVAQTHKFYLSFEKSLCSEFVTQQFFHAMARSIVPVVFGGANYSKIAPVHSYINARSFPDVFALAAYLQHLDRNLDEYLKYFEWKKEYMVVGAPWSTCGLCQTVFDEYYGRDKQKNRPPGFVPKSYANVQNWWQYQVDKEGVRRNSCESVEYLEAMQPVSLVNTRYG